ncbi:MAG: NAD-dependent epimerase/dehydratase family protein [Candidatus Aegiribacteria sp.]|nr:NAD-dependent epimerase/dehydratase family protein [Candidatus Aegiribacteria sp.]MBD3295455.1 NAD-dependent epimerase/dehydratase family protein [Candidatus Fermentibacteria bacterium]
MKIAITGATGFIGRNLAESFQHEGHEVTATGRSREVGELLKGRGIEFTVSDILDLDGLTNCFAGADLVIHCAGKSADRGSYREFRQINVDGTCNVIEACRSSDIRKIIFLSTPSIYYSGSDRFNVSENEPLPRRQFSYGKTKLMAERELLSAAREGISSIILRPRAVYGRYDHTIVPRILAVSERKKFPLINGGVAKVDITYIENLISAVRKCLSAPEPSWNQVYNISNGDPLAIREWFSTVLDIFQRPFRPRRVPGSIAYGIAVFMELVSKVSMGRISPAMTRFSVGYMASSLTMSIEKAKQKLGYLPSVSNREGFLKYRKWVDATVPPEFEER